jgi:hypothetical protein
MTQTFQLPPESEELHRAISQKAAVILGGFVDGNGLKAAQVRLGKHDTHIYFLPGDIAVELSPEVVKNQVKGRNPRGQVLASHAEVLSTAQAGRQALAAATDVQREIMQTLGQMPARGFGMEPQAITVHGPQKEFSVIDMCLKCNGLASLACALCNATGTTPCNSCNGQGFTSCQTCFGSGHTQDHQGTRMSCMRCQGSGRMQCLFCHGQRQMTCTLCRGEGKTGCTECAMSGFSTYVYQVGYKAECQFELDRREIPPDVQKVIDALGVKQMATEGHAEIFWMAQEARDEQLFIPFIACLPIAEAEFSVEGKVYPAIVAGLHGRIMQIDPLLDPIVKPGIAALMKLSKGPMAAQALIDTACKYKLIRRVLGGLTRASRKAVYQRLVKEYPVVLSEKYANATVRYAHQALESIGSGPRYKGLVAGTIFSGGLAAGYFMTSLRTSLGEAVQQKIIIADIVIWLIGFAIAVYTIKFMAAGAFRKLLPENVAGAKSGLPIAGMQGVWAFLTTLVAWFIAAAFSTQKPEWIIVILKPLGLLKV